MAEKRKADRLDEANESNEATEADLIRGCTEIIEGCVYLCKGDTYIKMCGNGKGFANERRWYRKLNNLNKGSPIYDMFLHPEITRSALIFKPNGNLISLHELAREKYITVRFLELVMVELKGMLQLLHKEGIYHNDIHDRNVLYDTDTSELYFIDLEKMSSADTGGDNDSLEELRESIMDPID